MTGTNVKANMNFNQKKNLKLDMEVQVCNPYTQEAKTFHLNKLRNSVFLKFHQL